MNLKDMIRDNSSEPITMEEYDKLFEEINKFKESLGNVCQIEKGTCIHYRSTKQKGTCCGNCKLLDKKIGCTTKNIACAMFYCAYLQEQVFTDTQRLEYRRLSEKYGQVIRYKPYYETEESVLKYLNISQ